ncbi:Brp/Blh family beta-carotene 15,15'-dioxygenase [Psychroserpens sp. Hel_I_66]|uniref:Brp/Blh family beta-carotene 15,15'-dioxygenase n=1 Tax=Psychroserpens sp. Hel_I_66 TaxID=1250004 RepID=UPI001E4B3F27|nr:Brp/Blh family beta-carotene 15,15'-dioxygenase [Psychroserpens sp. Hel_I_66]
MNISIYFITYLVIIIGFFSNLSDSNLFLNKICILLILTMGLIHGSNDLYLQSKSHIISKLKLSKRVFAYLIISLILVLVFIYKPALALLSFIIFSAFHFGEQQLYFLKLKNNFLSYALYTSLGCLIFIALFLNDFNEVKKIFNFFQLELFDQEIFKAMAALLILLTSSYLFSLNAIKAIEFKKMLEIYFQMATLFLLFYSTSLLAAFTFYFVFWHSLPSIYSQINSLRRNDSNYNIFSYIRNSSVVYSISIISIILIFILSANFELLMKILIIISASITIPHILTISQFYKGNSS